MGKKSQHTVNCVTSRRRRLTLDLLIIGRTRIVGVDLFRRWALIERDEAVQDVFACCVVVVAAGVIGEVVT